jgi:hypothetical protein
MAGAKRESNGTYLLQMIQVLGRDRVYGLAVALTYASQHQGSLDDAEDLGRAD